MGFEASLVAVLGKDRKPIGAGVLIDGGLIVTCAHVVNRALERGADETPPGEEVTVTLSGGRMDPVRAGLHQSDDAWSPASDKDLCLLKLLKDPPDGPARPALLADFDPRPRPFVAAGYPKHFDGDYDTAEGTVVGFDDSRNLYVLRPDPATKLAAQTGKAGFLKDQEAPAGLISEGFSGGPVEVGGQIVGLMSQARPPKEATAYMIPAGSFPRSIGASIQSLSPDEPLAREFRHIGVLNGDIRKRLREIADEIAPADLFDVRLRFCATFAEALRTQEVLKDESLSEGRPPRDYGNRDLRPGDLARRLQIGKDLDGETLSHVLLHAPGGAGKSLFLLKLLQAAPYMNLVPFLLDFSRNPNPPDAAKPDASAEEHFRAWWNKRGTGPVELLFQLAAKGSDTVRPLLVVDGLNQSPLDWQDVFSRLEEISRQELAGAVIVVADRMVDRNPDTRFRRAVTLPLAPVAYEAALANTPAKAVSTDSGWYSILASPLFLNKFLQMPRVAKAAGPGVIPSRFSILNQYFRDKTGCGFNQKEMRALCDFAYEAYRRFSGTAIPADSYEELLLAGGRMNAREMKVFQKKIEEQGLIQNLGKQYQFQHQILHDHLAAVKVASSTEQEDEYLLRAPAFDVLSLKGASFDAIELAVEALQYPDQLLETRQEALTPWMLLTEVYDWSYHTTLQCVASLDRRGDFMLRPWMRHSVFALNVERRFDPFLYTALRAERVREQIPQSDDLIYMHSESAADLREKLQRTLADTDRNTAGASDSERAYFEDWRRLYFREGAFTRDDLTPLWSDPLISWTAANVLRRVGSGDAVTDELMRLYDVSKATSDSAPRAAGFRWRIAHALGRAQPHSSRLLLGIVLNPVENYHVRYGAIRSVLELAAGLSADRQTEIFDTLRNRLGEMFPAKPTKEAHDVRQQLRRAGAFNEPHFRDGMDWTNWLGSGLSKYEGVLREGERLAAAGGSNEEASRWRQWADAAAGVAAAKDWPERRNLWVSVIEKDVWR